MSISSTSGMTIGKVVVFSIAAFAGLSVVASQNAAVAQTCKARLSAKAASVTLKRTQTAATNGWLRKARQKYGANFAIRKHAKNFAYRCSKTSSGYVCTASAQPCSRVRTIGAAPKCKTRGIRKGAFASGARKAEELAARYWENASRAKYGGNFAHLAGAKNRKVDCKPVGGVVACVISATPCNTVRKISP